MESIDLTPEEASELRAEAETWAYKPEQVESIFNTLARERSRLNRYQRENSEASDRRSEPEDSEIAPESWNNDRYPWEYCDPEMTILASVRAHHESWIKRFEKQLSEKPGVINHDAYGSLRAIFERLLGDGEAMTPHERIPIGRKAFAFLCDSSDHETYEAAYFSLKDDTDVHEAAWSEPALVDSLGV